MLWAIVSSVFVIYLYRTLNAAAGPDVGSGATPANPIDAALATLNERIGALESRVNVRAQETAP